eukprot:scaffold7052_cov254-Pinguiococcus_pyrenoidosus.AAC.35
MQSALAVYRRITIRFERRSVCACLLIFILSSFMRNTQSLDFSAGSAASAPKALSAFALP